ncbi:ferredoxin [Mycobacterium sp. NPDC003323]
MRIEADQDMCITAGNCVMVAGELFDQDDDGVVVVLTEDVPADEEGHAREAVKLCPASALKLVE